MYGLYIRGTEDEGDKYAEQRLTVGEDEQTVPPRSITPIKWTLNRWTGYTNLPHSWHWGILLPYPQPRPRPLPGFKCSDWLQAGVGRIPSEIDISLF